MIDVMKLVWRVPMKPIGGGPHHKLVLLYLADRADKNGDSIWPAIETICRNTGCCRREVQLVLRWAENLGVLHMTKKDTPWSPRHYRLDLAKLTELANGQPDIAPRVLSVSSRGAQPEHPGGASGAPLGAHCEHERAHGVHPTGARCAPKPSDEPSDEPSYYAPTERPGETSSPGNGTPASEARSTRTRTGARMPEKPERVGEPQPVGKRKRGRLVDDPELGDAVVYWADGFERLRGEAPPILGAQMCREIAPVVRQRGLGETKKLIDQFFESRDPLICRSDYSLSAFSDNVDRLLVPDLASAPSRTTSTVLDEVLPSQDRVIVLHTERANRDPADRNRDAAPAKDAWGSPEDLIAVWNQLAPTECPRVINTTEDMREFARRALKKRPERGYWEACFAELTHSSLLRGLTRSDRGFFTATFGWLSSANNETANFELLADRTYRDPGPDENMADATRRKAVPV